MDYNGQHIDCKGVAYLVRGSKWHCLNCEQFVPKDRVIKLQQGSGYLFASIEVMEQQPRVC